MRNFVRLPGAEGTEVTITSELPLSAAAWPVVGQIAGLAERLRPDGEPCADEERGGEGEQDGEGARRHEGNPS
jgi:hypothetical protein